MSILRKRTKSSYTNVDNTLVEDSSLSFRARGIAVYLMSKPDDWEIRISHLTAHAKEGKAAIQSALRELAETGYLMRERVYNREAGVVETVTHVADHPAFVETGTPDSRLRGYEATKHDDSHDDDGQDTDDSETDTSQNDISQTDVSVPRQSQNPVAIVTTDIPLTTDVVTTETEGVPPPDPSPPDGEARAEPDDVSEEPKVITSQQAMFGALCEAVGWDHRTLTKSSKGKICQSAKKLREAGYEAEDVGRFMTDVWFYDWRWTKNHDRPRLSQIQEEIGKIRAPIPVDMPRQQSQGAQAVDSFFAKMRNGESYGH